MTIENATPINLAKIVYQKLDNAKLVYPQPPLEVLERLFGHLFFTSLKTEEGQFIKLTITFIDPAKPDPKPPRRITKDRWKYIPFANQVPYNIKNLVKLSKAVDPWSASLAVYYNQSKELAISGMIDQAIHYQSFLHYESPTGPEQPGLFQASITNIGSIVVMYDYEMIASLKQGILNSSYIDIFRDGNLYELLKKHADGCKNKVIALLHKEVSSSDFDLLDSVVESAWIESLSRLLLRMQNYNHGGAILLTPDGDMDVNIKYHINYERIFTGIVDACKSKLAVHYYSSIIGEDWLEKGEMPIMLYLDETVSKIEDEESQHELKGAIRFVSSLTHIDGAVIMTPDLKVCGFGGVIISKQFPDEIFISPKSRISIRNLSSLPCNHFGTRHRSVFSYCWNHPNSIGFVVSQDGDIRVIIRKGDKLIMWENIRIQQLIKSRKLKKNFVKLNNTPSKTNS